MKKLLLLVPLAFAVFTAQAQVYTITTEGGDPVSNGSTINIEIPDVNTNNTQHLTLHSTTNDDFVFQVMGSTQVAGTENWNCVGASGHCFPPNDQDPHTEDLDASNNAPVNLEYKPNGYSDPAIIDFRISSPGNESINITFSINWTIATGIDEITNKSSLIAYPNPANGNVKISYKVSEVSEIVFYNIVGEQVKKIMVSAGTNQIDVETSALPSGTYFYSMISDSKITETKRLVIKH